MSDHKMLVANAQVHSYNMMIMKDISEIQSIQKQSNESNEKIITQFLFIRQVQYLVKYHLVIM